MDKHPIITDLETRKTSKHYDPTRRVSSEDMEVLYESLRLTASSINSQPWKFIVIESEEAKGRLEKTFARKNFHNKKHITDGSHVILLAHNPRYAIEDFAKVVDTDIANGRGDNSSESRNRALSKFSFAESKMDATRNNAEWTKAQVYIALGNALHVLARLDVDGTPMEGIDPELISEEFEQELDGYVCEVALVVGYHHPEGGNAKLPKSRLPRKDVLKIL
ncbi:nitroreductase family protein [Marinomonas pollencensis]|uniref:Nitroreductase/dihydropteridine reductase n=1 Tax=Marinomonas pollencensis TaxID=491954 RepID=A0A3E0DHR3_9GAMM|nr:nitroreductase family protein [Marinomonas pollencensis]REG82141.1 nitroreductase/dihydropteridine reductase [Marinomonas pollencensis]